MKFYKKIKNLKIHQNLRIFLGFKVQKIKINVKKIMLKIF